MTVAGYPTRSLGPFVRGVVDAANPLGPLDGLLRYARNAAFSGVGRLQARPGTQATLQLVVDSVSHFPMTSVCALTSFGDRCLAVGHIASQQKFFLYWLDDLLTGWYDVTGAFTPGPLCLPVATLWTVAPNPDKVLIAEGLNVAYIAHNNPAGVFATQKFDASGAVAVLSGLTADLRGAGLETTFFHGVVSFENHLWGWGYGSHAAGDTERPELLRFSTPFFGALSAVDNFAVGHRVRSRRDTITGAIVAGDTLYVGLNYALWPITGFGRNSWDKSRPLDNSEGLAGPYAGVEARGGWFYYWSHRGPLRVFGRNAPEPLWQYIENAWQGTLTDGDIIAAYDHHNDLVLWIYQNATNGAVRAIAGFDVVRNVIVGPDGDIGLGVRCWGFIPPATIPAPAGPPTVPVTSTVGAHVATAAWTPGDTNPTTVTQIEIRVQGTAPWIIASASIPSGQNFFVLTGLLPDTAYEWRVAHKRGLQFSAYLGPVAGTQFATGHTLLPPVGITARVVGYPNASGFLVYYVELFWVNTGEATDVVVSVEGPDGAPPASGTVTVVKTVAPGISTYLHPLGAAPAAGTYYAEMRAVQAGLTSSPYAPVAPIGATYP